MKTWRSIWLTWERLMDEGKDDPPPHPCAIKSPHRGRSDLISRGAAGAAEAAEGTYILTCCRKETGGDEGE